MKWRRRSGWFSSFDRFAASPRPRAFALLALAVAMFKPASTPAFAQQAHTVIRVLVKAEQGQPLGDVELTLASPADASGAAGSALQSGRTGGDGRFSFAVPTRAGSYQLTARRLGYAPAVRGVATGTADTLSIEVTLTQVIPKLAPVIVDAGLRPERRPFIDSTEIASSKRLIMSLADVLNKLRFGLTYQSNKCLSRPGKGMFTRGPIPGPRLDYGLGGIETYVNGKWIPREWDPSHLIRSEHIAEVRFVNCFDSSIEDLPPQPWASVYVTLKPGIAWSLARGSYVDSARHSERP
jgi:hypothetical protein